MGHVRADEAVKQPLTPPPVRSRNLPCGPVPTPKRAYRLPRALTARDARAAPSHATGTRSCVHGKGNERRIGVSEGVKRVLWWSVEARGVGSEGSVRVIFRVRDFWLWACQGCSPEHGRANRVEKFGREGLQLAKTAPVGMEGQPVRWNARGGRREKARTGLPGGRGSPPGARGHVRLSAAPLLAGGRTW